MSGSGAGYGTTAAAPQIPRLVLQPAQPSRLVKLVEFTQSRQFMMMLGATTVLAAVLAAWAVIEGRHGLFREAGLGSG